ncbi:MAG TPA: PP0621 family protein [Burkholderiales bacterium]|nr:PP0621 family protein [Burkholderiales bacterium]
MNKLLLVIIAALLVYWILRSYRESPLKPGENRDTAVEDMVRCAHCGVNLPKSESLISSQGDFFCSREHLRLHSSGK